MTDTTEFLSGIALSARQERLKETDHWGLADYPATAEQLAYRQALRDMPTEQSNYPNEVTWPDKPEE